jgi:DNA polymerase III delta subunit
VYHSKSIGSKYKIEQDNKSVYSDGEEENTELDFDDWVKMLKDYFSKQNTFELFSLKNIVKLHLNNSNKSNLNGC